MLGPGSDIRNEPEIIISQVNESHTLMFNKYCIHPSQLLLLTLDSYRRQHEALNTADFTALKSVLEALQTPHFAFFNCSEHAGASRQHKHMQIFPRDRQDAGFGSSSAVVGNNSIDASKVKLFIEHRNPDSLPKPPFTYFLHRFSWSELPESPNQLPPVTELLAVYTNLLGKCRSVFGVAEGELVPHNMVVVQEWMMLIPRTSAGYKGLYSNAAGMLGMVWISDQETADRWIKVGPATVLTELGVKIGE